MGDMTATEGARTPAQEAVDRLFNQGFLDDLMDGVDDGGVQLTGEGGFFAGDGETGVGGRSAGGAERASGL